MIDQELMDILVCPLCLSELKEKEEQLHCTREDCGCVYPVDDGIPVTLIEEADRPCPECGEDREWVEAESRLVCPECGAELQRGE